ncbi:MAG TPA: hypothetical protein PKB13_08810 [Clostridia bacterium]|nr:hypothetical protein [Clostridia bacterium]
MKTPLYCCDPEKNVSCNKRGCAYNPNAENPVCNSIVNREYAKLENGKPLMIWTDELKDLDKEVHHG